MSKREQFWETVPRDAAGNIAWPSDVGARTLLAQEMLGARIVGAVEAVVENRQATVRGEGVGDLKTRAIFASMSDDQRVQVQHLLKEACFSTLYWTLVKLKDYPDGTVDITITPYHEGSEQTAISMLETELFHHYFNWVERFSDLGDA